MKQAKKIASGRVGTDEAFDAAYDQIIRHIHALTAPRPTNSPTQE